MARKKQASFKMKGHTLPGINQKSGTENLKDGRSPSSAFQMKEAGDSPLEAGWLGKAANIMTGGLSGGIGKAMKGDFKGALGSVATGGLSSLVGGGGGGDEDAEAGKELLKDEAKESMEGDSAMVMNLGPKNKLGGKLNEGTSPHQNI